jgi:hypothetical protein
VNGEQAILSDGFLEFRVFRRIGDPQGGGVWVAGGFYELGEADLFWHGVKVPRRAADDNRARYQC